jgi:hypothetical protein
MVVVVTDALLNGAALRLRSAVGIVTLGVLSLAGFSRADGELRQVEVLPNERSAWR